MNKLIINEIRKAVALEYDAKQAPRVTAKAEGCLADQIIEIAKEHGVHLHQDKELVKLLSCIELGDEIPESLYITMAQIIAFVYWLEGKSPNKS